MAIELRQVHKHLKKLPITLLLWHDVFGLKISLYLKGLSLAEARDKIKFKKAGTFSIKEKVLSKNFITLNTKITVVKIVYIKTKLKSWTRPRNLNFFWTRLSFFKNV